MNHRWFYDSHWMKRFLVAVIILHCTNVYGGEISQGDIALHLKALSSAEFEGRLSGNEGGRKAREYIAQEFKKISLTPAAGGSYFQPFNISVKKIGKDNRLSIAGEEFRIFEDYAPLTVCPQDSPLYKRGDRGDLREIKGRAAFIDSDKDVKDKIAMVRYDEAAPDGWLASKIREAGEKGARALLILKKDLYSDYTVWEELIPPGLRARWEKTHGEDLPKFLRMKVAQKRNLTLPVISKIPCLLVREDRLLKESENPLPFDRVRGGREREGMGLFSGKISIKVDIMEESISARNLIGYLPGKGGHKDETVIIGAHYDHLGLDSKGHFFPGADDNASGVSVMLHVAKRLAEKGHDRSILFIAFDGEEWGLTGSRYYTDHPVFPLDKTVLIINMDTVGRNEPDAVHFLGSLRCPDVREVTGKVAEKSGLKLLDDIEFAFKYGSDHYPFYEKGIPAIDLTSSYHEDFHRTTDTPEKINVDKVSKIADLVYRLALEVADSEIYFQNPLHVDVPFPKQ